MNCLMVVLIGLLSSFNPLFLRLCQQILDEVSRGYRMVTTPMFVVKGSYAELQ